MSRQNSALAVTIMLLGLIAQPLPAGAVMGYNAIGTGKESDDCIGPGPTCTVEFTIPVSGGLGGTAFKNAKLVASLTVLVSASARIDNGSGGYCYPASGAGTINAIPGGTVNVSMVGLFCNTTYTTMSYNASYFIGGGAQ